MPDLPKVGVVTFPGSLDDGDTRRAIAASGAEPIALWHGDSDLQSVQAVVLPGGFSYGDYLRCGAIARFAEIMRPIIDAAHQGMPVLGICNGFQILCEAGLLPGALIRNAHLRFRARDQWLTVDNVDSAWTSGYEHGQKILIPVKHGEGRYVIDSRGLSELEAENRIVVRYSDSNPNGSCSDIAGVTNERGNVVGLMPHPEHAINELTGPSDHGLVMFSSLLKMLVTNS